MTPMPTARLLPLLVITSFIMLGVRGYDLWQGVNYGTASVANEPAHAPATPTSPTPAPATAAPQATAAHEAPAAKPAAAPSTPANAEAPKAEDAPTPAEEARGLLPAEYTPAEVAVLQNLASRRDALDKQEAELEQREALLAAAQQQVETKIKELQDVKGELQNLLHMVDDQQKARIDSLVKIYETMKPREAAAIIETLDMPVALDVLGKMRETKSAPILASMDPKKASQITVEMSRQQQLPQIPQ